MDREGWSVLPALTAYEGSSERSCTDAKMMSSIVHADWSVLYMADVLPLTPLGAKSLKAWNTLRRKE